MSATRTAILFDALIPLLFLITSLFLSVRFFGEDSSYGPNQVALMLSGIVALLIGMKNSLTWGELEKSVFSSMGVVFMPCFILLAVGMMIALWLAAGIVPTLVFWGLKLMSPAWFYAASCLVCAIISLSIGSSWTTAASIGVALMGTAAGLGLSLEITAGAIVSGAYFGDKMSPLSDTTNLAPAVAGVDLFAHIRHMGWTGIPAISMALIGFLILGLFGQKPVVAEESYVLLGMLQENFTLGWYLLLPLLLLLGLAWLKVPALLSLLSAALAGALFAYWFQPASFAADASALKVLWQYSVSGYTANTGQATLDKLLSGGGAAGMLNTIWLILSAVFFGGAMEACGFLQALVGSILRLVNSAAGLISATIFTCIGMNIVTGDQYIAIVLPGRMYKQAYSRLQLAPVNLSRALEDSATVTSALVPWNTCGAYMAATLGVATLAYLPYSFFNLIMPLLSIAYGMTGFKIMREQTPVISSPGS